MKDKNQFCFLGAASLLFLIIFLKILHRLNLGYQIDIASSILFIFSSLTLISFFWDKIYFFLNKKYKLDLLSSFLFSLFFTSIFTYSANIFFIDIFPVISWQLIILFILLAFISLFKTILLKDVTVFIKTYSNSRIKKKIFFIVSLFIPFLFIFFYLTFYTLTKEPLSILNLKQKVAIEKNVTHNLLNYRLQLIAKENNLGIIELKFNNNNQFLDTQIRFRIKENGSENWYYESYYNTDQIKDNKYFPFGFKPITGSKNKKILIEIQTDQNIDGSVFEPSTKIYAKYSKPDSFLAIFCFILKKIINLTFSTTGFFILLLIVFFYYFLLIKFHSHLFKNTLLLINIIKKEFKKFFLLKISFTLIFVNSVFIFIHDHLATILKKIDFNYVINIDLSPIIVTLIGLIFLIIICKFLTLFKVIFYKLKMSVLKISKKEGFLLMIIIALTLVNRLDAFSYFQNSPDSFMMPSVAYNLVNQIKTGGFSKIVFFDWTTESGRYYPRSRPYTLLLAIIFYFFGINDLTCLSISIFFGLLTNLTLYFIFKKIINFKWAFFASLLIALSGWDIAFSTLIRHYSFLAAFFMLSLYSLLGFLEEKSSTAFWTFLILIAFTLQIDFQSVVLIATSIILLVFFLIKTKLNVHKKIQNKFLLALLIIMEIGVILNYTGNNLDYFLLINNYHSASFFMSFITVIIFIIGLMTLIKTEYSKNLLLFIISSLILIPFFASIEERRLLPRYIYFYYLFYLPIFIVGVKYLYNNLFKLKKNITKFILAVTIIVSLKGLILPWNSYQLDDIWPEYLTRITKNQYIFSKIKLVAFKEALIKITSNSHAENSILLLSDVPPAMYWYVKVNEKTKTSNIDLAWLLDEQYGGYWVFNQGDIDYRSISNKKKIETERYDIQAGIPVISSIPQLIENSNKYNETYIILTDYRYRNASFHQFLEIFCSTIFENENLTIYQLQNRNEYI